MYVIPTPFFMCERELVMVTKYSSAVKIQDKNYVSMRNDERITMRSDEMRFTRCYLGGPGQRL